MQPPVVTLSDIPTATLIAMGKQMVEDGWRKLEEYEGYDAWIDYAHVVLEKEGITVTLEWDNWMEGTVTAPASQVASLRDRYLRRHG